MKAFVISVQEKREARASGKNKAVKQTPGSGSGKNGGQVAGEQLCLMSNREDV